MRRCRNARRRFGGSLGLPSGFRSNRLYAGRLYGSERGSTLSESLGLQILRAPPLGSPVTRIAALVPLSILFLAGLSGASHLDPNSRQRALQTLRTLYQASTSGAAQLSADVPFLPAHPGVNISGTFKGDWRVGQFNERVVGLNLLRKPQGLVIYHLRSYPTSTGGVHNVEGQISLRTGVYLAEDDVQLDLQGLFIPETGQLKAIIEPASSILHTSLDSDEPELNTADYRAALRHVADRWNIKGVDTASRYPLVDSVPLQKHCEFMLELTVEALNPEAATPHPGRRLLRALRTQAPPQDSQYLAASERNDLAMNGTITSQNCHMQLQLFAETTHQEQYFSKAVNYTLLMTALSFIQVLLLIRQMEATSTPALASKVSLITIGQQAVMDSYLCLLHLTTGIMVDPLFNAFATAAFFEFVIFAIFEMRYLLVIWRARRGSNVEPWVQQRELSLLYGRFYGFLLTGIFMMYNLQRFMHVLAFALCSFWLPQIVSCVKNDARQPLKPAYIIGISVTRLALPLYLYGCPKNLLEETPSLSMCLGLSLFVAAQAAILLLQSYAGPRCFVPRRFLPEKYNYWRKVLPKHVLQDAEGPADIETGHGSVECVICMNMVDVEIPQARMVTPCPEGDKWAGCQAFENYRDLIDAPNRPDAVIIGVPPDRHGEKHPPAHWPSQV
ncbi:hypothetical protein WJX74_006344 [Apatococcus lobatus]|uniref:RING-type E3 ubiquitin transferase n=1 Tax=Apatococcus lobatus TaxID=904363 RepID=A0AAW1QHS9_9CHLO